jgi:alkylation response protein AidB-like acyl-CoA dehydrogenase
MDLEFSGEQQELKQAARRYLADKCPPVLVRSILETNGSYSPELWAGLGEMGYLAAGIPEIYGGLGLGDLELCVIAEELGRALAPVPMVYSIYLAAELILTAGSEAQRREWLPKLASGQIIGTVADAEARGPVTASSIRTLADNERLFGTKSPVLDGGIANVAIVLARSATSQDLSLYITPLDQPGVARCALKTIDPSRGQSSIVLDGAEAERLGPAGAGEQFYRGAIDRAAVLTAFEQIGGADRALEMARDYALERMAFGRQIGSFQAIKHMLADMYVAAALARANSYFGAWALATRSAELGEAAASARVSATRAYQLCAKNSIQVHGGVGFTWDFDCHLYFRRANLLAVSLGGLSEWEDRLIDQLRAKTPAKVRSA